MIKKILGGLILLIITELVFIGYTFLKVNEGYGFWGVFWTAQIVLISIIVIVLGILATISLIEG